MRKIYSLRNAFILAVFAVMSMDAFAQPSAMSVNQDVSGTYTNSAMTLQGAAFRARFQENGSGTVSGTRNWQFNADAYFNQWGTTAGAGVQTLAAYNTVTTPNTSTASGNWYTAGYNSNGRLPATTANYYYTYNIIKGTSYASQRMAVLETSFNPVTISGVSEAAGSNGSRTVTITTSATPAAGENIFVRYSTNSFTNSTLVLASGSGTTWTATIPWQSSAVSYYVYTSNRTKAQIDAAVTSFATQEVHDLLTLELNNNSGSNYTWTPASFAGPIVVFSTGGTGAAGTNYPTLTLPGGAFAALNGGTAHTGTVNVYVVADVTTESGTTALNGSAAWTSMTINPTGVRTISGAAAAGSPLIDFNGADNVMVDGLNIAGNSLTISNTTAAATSGTATIRFQADATGNTITNCSILGSSTMAVGTNGGNIWFGAAAVTTGNDNNTISNCNIGPAGANLPSKGIYFTGTSTPTTLNNSGNIIDNNNIFDVFQGGVESAAIYSTTGSTGNTITNNRIYQTGSRTYTGTNTHTGIKITNTTSAAGFTITGNIIGYASNTQTGTYTLTGSTGKFVGIYFSGLTGGTNSSINNNTIASVSMTGVTSSGTSTSSPFTAILLNNGLATVNNNTIGSQSATGSLVFSTNTTTATDVHGIYLFPSDASTTVSNNIGGLTANNAGATGAFITYGIRSNQGTALNWTGTSNIIGGTVANSIQNNSTSTTAQLIGMASNGTFASIGNLTSNTIRNLTAAGGTGTTTSASVIGILMANSTPSHTISQNTISNLSNTNTTAATVVTGIQFTGATTNIVERNYIHSLSSSTTSASAEINGIRVAGGTTTYRNNMIALGAGVANAIGAAASNSGTTGINGINEALGTNQFFHNSVYIGGTATAGTGTSYAFNGTQTVNTRSFRDNIFFNARTNSGATGKHYAVKINGTAPNPGGLTINNNVYFANGTGGVFGFFNSLDVANLSGWKTAVGQDANSYESNPQYNDPTNTTPDLHIHPTNTTVAEGNGVDVGVTGDYDGQTRSGLTPVDIGADAGNFTGVDLAAPAISYTNLTNTTSTANRTTSSFATITDLSGVNVTAGTAPRIYYKRTSDVNNTFNDNTSATVGWKYAESTTGSSPFDFTIDYSLLNGAPVAVGDVIQYFVVAQDLAATPNVGINSGNFAATPASVALTAASFPVGGTINTYTIIPSISGIKTIPGDYASLTLAGGAFEAINNAEVTGDITLQIAGDLIGENGTVKLNEFASPYTVTIKPTGSARSITGSSAGSIIGLNAADRVIIDGSLGSTVNTVCPPVAATRDLTITNTNTGTSSAVVWLQSSGANGATNNTVKNCIITGNSNTTTLFGIGSGSTTISTSTLGTGNNNNSFVNNNISKTQYGIFTQGASAANKNTGTIINQNSINTVSPNNVQIGGIYVGFDNGSTISANSVSGMVSGTDAFGISTGVTGWVATTTTGNEVSNAVISKNVIGLVQNTGTNSAAGILTGPSATGTNQLSNNMVYGVIGNSTPGDLTAGIFTICGVGATQVYYNTVSMTGDRGSGTTGSSLALAVMGTDPVIDIRNNLLINKQTTASTGKSYAIGLGYSTFVNLTSNYNDFFTSGANANFAVTAALNSGTDRTTLALWQTATGKDANSKNLDAVFISATDLHLNITSNPGLDAAATPISVTDDIDCDTRDAVTPDIGADEFTQPVVTDAGVTAIVMPNPFCAGSNLVSATVKNYGTTTITSVLIDWSVTPGGSQPQVNPGAISIAPGASQTFPLGNFTFAAGTVYSITAFTSNPNGGADGVPGNDSYTNPTLQTGMSGTYTVGTAGNYTTLTAAIADYNTRSLCGAVVFELQDASYTEAGSMTIAVNAAASATNTLTIRPATGVTASVSATVASGAVLKILGKYVTIDGSNNGSNSRDLSFTNGSVTGPNVVLVGSTGVTPITNVTVKNCNLINGDIVSSTMLVGDGTTIGNAGYFNDIVIQNNSIQKGFIGLYCRGVAATGNGTGVNITTNDLAASGANANSYIGIYVEGVDGGTVQNNIIGNFDGNDDEDDRGIWIASGSKNCVIRNNTISDLNYLGTSGYGTHGIVVTSGLSSAGIVVSNNMISGLSGDGWSYSGVSVLDNTIGIVLSGTQTGVSIYHNSINLSGNTLNQTDAMSMGIYLGSGSVANIRDNIIVNNLGLSGATGYGAVGVYAVTSNSQLAASDYNNYSVNPSGSGNKLIGKISGTNAATIAAWRTATGSDVNSINVVPLFTSATDLHLTAGNGALKAGTPIAGITTDIDGNNRNLGLPTIGADEIYVPNLWAGTVSTVWDGVTTGNWDDATVPSSGANITIPFGVPNMPVIANNTNVGDLTFKGTGATVSLNGQTFTVNGAITGNGTLSGSSTSNLTLGGAAGTVSFTSGSRSINNLNLGATASATLGTALDIYGTVGFTAGGSLNMNAQAVTLKSNATNTARIADLTGSTLTGATNVTMERYIKLRAGGDGRAYRLLTPTVNTTGSMRLNWMENGLNSAIGTNDNPVPGYGIQITGSGGNANGFDKTQTNQSSAYSTANGVTPTYTAIASTGNAMDAKTGYFMYVRGDRSMDMQIPLGPNMPTSATTLRATGTVLQGTQTTFNNAYTGGGALNLVTNPYPSPIDWSLVQPAATGITGSYTYWDANIGTRGGFATVTTGGVSTPATSATQIIQSGQAFFVESDGSVPTVSIQEGHKVAGNNNDVFLVPPPPVESFRTELYFTEPNGYRRIADGAIALYDNNYSKAVDAKDAKEINNWDENIAISRDGKHLAIEARPVIGKSDDLPIFMNNMKQQAYEFEFTPLVFTNTNLKAELVDNYLGTRTLLSVTSPTVVAFTITADAASKATDRFKVVFGEFGNPTGVDVITIKANQKNDGVQVDWSSKTETDMVRYEVEKSTYGTNFAKVNTTAAIGNSNAPVDYNWFDTNPHMGTSFYRIRGIDKAGNVRYSEMVRVLFGKGEPAVVVYPNPVQGRTFKIDMYNLVKGTYVLSLYSNEGRLVHTQQLQHDGSQATRTITLNGDIAQGAYQLQLSGAGGFKTTKQIIKN
ncbi:MAG: hypothetical protein JNM14_12550 [Ferruginibacter sp.]|nr:hypothetical protein [Ferruginibacter sp.]